MTSSSGPRGPGATREARIQRTRAWLRHARSLLRGEAEAEPYHVTFWVEQAAEKALKGALVWAEVPFGPTHDLDALAARLPQGWQAGRAAGVLRELTLYATETRYPDLGEPEPTAEDAARAVEQAGAVQGAAPDPTRRSRPPRPPHAATVGMTADRPRARRRGATQDWLPPGTSVPCRGRAAPRRRPVAYTTPNDRRAE